MPMVRRKECGIEVRVTRTLPTLGRYDWDWTRCPISKRPSTSKERFVDAASCPHMASSITDAAQRGDI